MSNFRPFIALTALAIATMLATAAQDPVSAAVTFTVNSTNDADDGVCDSAHCSLREAINAANANAGSDVIRFSAALGFSPVIRPLGQLPPITDSLSLYGGPGNSFGSLLAPGQRVTLDGSLAGPGVHGLVVSSSSTLVKSLTLHSFSGNGLLIDNPGPTGNQIDNNIIGTDPGLMRRLGNGQHGILVSNSANNYLIDNYVVANTLDGVRFDGTGSHDNLVFGGKVGVGFRPLGNEGNGVAFASGAHHNTINTIDQADSSIAEIANNGGAGIRVEDTADFNAFWKVSIHSNAGLGVDLGAPGADPNDALDSDSGANALQNSPVVTGVTYSPAPTSATAEVYTAPNTQVNFIFFTSRGCDPSGIGEGAGYAGGRGVVTDINGYATVTTTLIQTVYSQQYQGSAVTAMVIGNSTIQPPLNLPVGQASEFSPCFLPPGPDADGDGFPDAMDTCPLDANPDQRSTDRNFLDTTPPYSGAGSFDGTVTVSDNLGDACDPDDDNDGVSDADEASGSGCSGMTTAPEFADTDADRYIDGAECMIGSNPTDTASKPTAMQCSAHLGVALSTDTDGDKLRDYVEFCHYSSSPSAIDSDSDGTKDGCEAVSLNADAIVNSIDQGSLATLFSGGGKLYFANTDPNKDGVINSIDQGLMATFILPGGQCP